ncbi:hypothetical protein V1514DRAFT_317480 [Lipomyces japonicus]|uniref:uncharacterized protein n=1 Tax=Lipomyces japonicus TaxID=56871 RepID=UPI0034CD3B19
MDGQRHSPSPSATSKPIAIPLPTPRSSGSGVLPSATISPTQMHQRRSSMPSWAVNPSYASPNDGMKNMFDRRASAAASFLPGSPDRGAILWTNAQYHTTENPPFSGFNFGSFGTNSTPSKPSALPSPPMSPKSSLASPQSSVSHDQAYVVCDHHHHRRASCAVQFLPPEQPIEQGARMQITPDGKNSSTPRRMSGRFERRPSPTGERILKGEFSF